MSALKPLSSSSQALDTTVVAFTVPAPQTSPMVAPAALVRVYSDRNFHVAVGATDATTDDLPVSDHLHGVLIHLDAGERLSAVKATGETAGTIWFTVVRRH